MPCLTNLGLLFAAQPSGAFLVELSNSLGAGRESTSWINYRSLDCWFSACIKSYRMRLLPWTELFRFARMRTGIMQRTPRVFDLYALLRFRLRSSKPSLILGLLLAAAPSEAFLVELSNSLGAGREAMWDQLPIV
ncbi:hypothetical protein HPP92_021841 [Vanilla planifolia]|uniref:Secreted protein n=1 Tax=Vanilla planifolia TaxID=51239 RepID=A0A835UFW2_VANPL|nr:hypothetical protein HPP92_021841 [Vanilla planifolia]